LLQRYSWFTRRYIIGADAYRLFNKLVQKRLGDE